MSTTASKTFEVTKQYLLDVKLPRKTKSYSPVPHKHVIETSLEAFSKANIPLISETYTAARDGRQANGIYHLAGGDAEMNLRLQWQNSYDKSRPLAAGFGSHVVICGNGLIIGDMGRFKRKHTGTVLTEFKESIMIYVDKAGELFEKMKHDQERMKEITMTKRTCAELIGRMFLEDDIITATQLGIIKRELENPTYNYGTDADLLKKGGTLWDCYNAVTCSLKEAHPQFNMQQHVDLHDFVTKEFVKEFA